MIKMRLKNTVVNVTSPKEWDIVTRYYGYKWHTGTFDFYESHTCISCYCQDFSIVDFYARELDGYEILHFEKWLEMVEKFKGVETTLDKMTAYNVFCSDFQVHFMSPGLAHLDPAIDIVPMTNIPSRGEIIVFALCVVFVWGLIITVIIIGVS